MERNQARLWELILGPGKRAGWPTH